MATSLRVRCCRRMEHTLKNLEYMEILAIWERANNFFAKKCELSTYQQFVQVCKVYRILGGCRRNSTCSSAVQNLRRNIGCFDRTPVVKSSNFFSNSYGLWMEESANTGARQLWTVHLNWYGMWKQTSKNSSAKQFANNSCQSLCNANWMQCKQVWENIWRTIHVNS